MHWKLLPLLLVGLVNDLIWCRVVTLEGLVTVVIVVLLVLAIVAGIVTPMGLWWFSAVCMCIPPLVTGGGFILLAGFVFPPLWIYFLMNFVPVFLICAGLVLLGCGVRRCWQHAAEGS